MTDPADITETEAMLAVVAHGLLNTASVVAIGIDTLRASWAQMTEQQRATLLDTLSGQARTIVSVIEDMMRALPQRALDGLQAIREVQLDVPRTTEGRAGGLT